MNIQYLQTRLSYRVRSSRLRSGYSWLQRQRIKSFYHIVEELSLEKGASALMQTSGVGKLAPNVILMGFKTHWRSCNRKDLQEYFNVLQWVESPGLCLDLKGIRRCERFFCRVLLAANEIKGDAIVKDDFGFQQCLWSEIGRCYIKDRWGT